MLRKQASMVMVSAFIASSCLAEMVKFTDFEQYNNDQVLANNVAVSTDGWTKSTDANNRSFETRIQTDEGGNKYMLQDKTGAAGGYATAANITSQGLATGFYATTNPNDGFQTLFFRFMVDSSQGTAGYAGFGVVANEAVANPLVKCGFKVDGSGNILNSSLASQGTINLDTWYNAWFAVDHRGTDFGSSAVLYLQSDDDVNFNSQTIVGSGFYSGAGALAYKTLLFTSEHPNGLNLAVDDIYYDNGNGGSINLVNPIPEPGTLGLISAFGGAVLFVRRRLMI